MNTKITKLLIILIAVPGFILTVFICYVLIPLGTLGTDVPKDIETLALIAPLLYVVLLMYGWENIRTIEKKYQKQTMRSEIHDEMGLPGEHDEQQVLRALGKRGQLSVKELEQITAIKHEELMKIVGAMMRSGVILQHSSLGGSYLTLAEHKEQDV